MAAVRAALWIVPFRMLNRALGAWARRPASTRFDPATVARAVGAAARRIPQATCLTQALAGKVICARHGIVADLRLGVGRDANGVMRAHAWLELDGRSILGDPQPESFVPLPPVGLP